MKSCSSLAATALMIAMVPATAAAQTNIAEGAEVTFSAPGPGTTPALLATVTDGIFLPEQTQWQTGTAWWMGGGVMTIHLGQTYSNIFRVLLQADNNDAYAVQYRDVVGNIWVDLITFGFLGPFGMITRPPADFTPFSTDQFRVFAVAGDNLHAVSEFQAFVPTQVVPEPVSLVLLGTGLFGVAAARRRRRASIGA